MPAVLNPNSLPPPNDGSFFGTGSWLPSITWGGNSQPPPMPTFAATAPPVSTPGPQGRGLGTLPPPNIPQMPQIQQPYAAPGPNEAWGSPNTIPQPSPEAAGMPSEAAPQPSKYSFLDQPGASDSLVAFGAAMLKAPDFNTGLGDAALAVNKVARENRPLGAVELEKAKQLAMLKRVASGRGVTKGGASINRDILYSADDGHTYFDAIGPNGEPTLYDQNTGQFTDKPVPGLRRDTFDFNMNKDKRLGNKDADFENDWVKQVPDLANTVANLDGAIELAGDPESAVSSSMYARVGGELERLAPGMNLGWNGYDANKITEYDNRLRQAGIAYARMSFQGQGQVTDNERKMIAEAVGQRGTMTTGSTVKMLKAMRAIAQRKIDIINSWKANAGNVQQEFGGDFGAYVANRVALANAQQMAAAAAAGESDSTASGSTGSEGQRKPLTDIFK